VGNQIYLTSNQIIRSLSAIDSLLERVNAFLNMISSLQDPYNLP
jgi:hypothetical protein